MYQVARDDTVSLEELQRQIAESEGSAWAKVEEKWRKVGGDDMNPTKIGYHPVYHQNIITKIKYKK